MPRHEYLSPTGLRGQRKEEKEGRKEGMREEGVRDMLEAGGRKRSSSVGREQCVDSTLHSFRKNSLHFSCLSVRPSVCTSLYVCILVCACVCVGVRVCVSVLDLHATAVHLDDLCSKGLDGSQDQLLML